MNSSQLFPTPCFRRFRRLIVNLFVVMLTMTTGAQAIQDPEAAFEKAADAIAQSDVDLLREVLDGAPHIVVETNVRGDTLLNLAAQQGSLEAARVLIAADANIDGVTFRPLSSALFGLAQRDLGMVGTDKSRRIFIEVFEELILSGAEYDFYEFGFPFIVSASLRGVCRDRFFEDDDLEVVERLPIFRIRETDEAERGLKVLALMAQVPGSSGECSAIYLRKIELE